MPINNNLGNGLMQQYWINQGGVQAGPVTIDELEKMKVGPDAYVWRSGLDDWVKITELPELAVVIAPAPAPEPPAIEPQVAAPDLEPDEEAAPEPVTEPEAESEPAEASELTDEPLPPPLPQPAEPCAASQQAPKCPPTNLGWGIVAVLLCQPLGILAIVLGVMVKSKYDAGEYDRAVSLSEWSAWSCIAAITLGVGFGWIGALVSLLV